MKMFKIPVDEDKMSGKSPQETGPKILVSSTSPGGTRSRDNEMGPPSSASVGTVGSSKHNPGLLGSDLVPPARSEFRLKTRVDPDDRGRPMVDWIRRQSAQDSANYSKNLLKTMKVQEVNEQMLNAHCTTEDAWMALRGQVYDVTDYVSFHPGGVKEIMKGVGKDGTALFNSIHRYVNFESILKGKQVGIYAPNRTSLLGSDGADLAVSNFRPGNQSEGDGKGDVFCSLIPSLCSKRLTACFSCCGKDDQLDFDELMIPTTKFREDKEFCFYTINLNNIKYNENYWTASILQKELLLLKVVITPPEMWVGHYKLREALLNDTINICFTNRFRTMTIKLEKPRELTWKSIGEPLPDSNLILDSRYSIDDRNACVVVVSEEISRDMFLFAVEVSPCARIGVPIGFDVKVTAVKQDVSRRYTPVPLIFHPEKYRYESTNEVIYFVIKIYPNGKVTQILKKLKLLKPGELEIGYSCGNFNTDWLHGADTYFLFGAGSGITPFLSILQYYLEHNVALGVSHVVLCHWVKEQVDLIWEEEFYQLQKKKKWFKFLPVLTQVKDDDETWTGLRGRISDEMLRTILEKLPPVATRMKKKVRFMTCGPVGFNNTTCTAIEFAGYPLDSTFIFLG